MQSSQFKILSLCCFNFLLIWLLLTLYNLPEPNFQTSPSLLELLFMDSWSESETLNFSNARSSSVRFLFFCFRAFFTCSCTITFTSCLVNLFFLSKCLLFFCFVCLTSALRVVHWSVVCQHVLLYQQNFFPVCPRSESLFSDSLKVTAFLFLDPFLLFLLFLEGALDGIVNSKFSILVSKSFTIECIGPSK